jgi:hypothetical protein
VRRLSVWTLAIGLGVVCAEVTVRLAGSALLHQRFPTTSLTPDTINRTGTPLANTRSAFLATGAPGSLPFRVLFYGQSISEGRWTEEVIARWRARYPHLAIVVDNRAIGGFESSRLKDTVAADIADLSPDLVVFHAYGSHVDYETTIRQLAAMTGADIVLQTDHATAWPPPRCDTGASLVPLSRPGCTGYPFRRQIGWDPYMSYHFVPAMAARYGLAVEPRLERWTESLRAAGQEPSDLLSDTVHLNDRGQERMASLFDAFIVAQVHSADEGADEGAAASRRLRVEVPPADADGSLSFRVQDAYRVEAVTAAPLPARGLVLVDGVPAEQRDSCHAHGRPDRLAPDLVWPPIRQVGAAAPLVEETWVATLTDLSEGGARFAFTVTGSVTGPDGTGTSATDFVSGSGRVVLRAQDWMIELAHALHGLPLDGPLTVTWDTRYLCDDTVRVPTSAGDTLIRTLVTGLDGGDATITLRPGPDGLPPIDHILVTPARLPRPVP